MGERAGSRSSEDEVCQRRWSLKRMNASDDENNDGNDNRDIDDDNNADADKNVLANGDSTSEQHRTKRTRLDGVPAPLTRKNLARFEKMGRAGKKEKSASGSGHGAAARRSEDAESEVDTSLLSLTSTSSKALSTTAPGFAMKARDNGILYYTESRPPGNLAELRGCLAQPRESESPPESFYEAYADNIQSADNESTVLIATVPLLQNYPLSRYRASYNQAWTAFPKDAGLNNGLSAPQPDFVEGLDMGAFRPLPVNSHISGAVLYKDNTNSVTLPHIAGEWKGPGGDMREAALRSSYDGAAMVYAHNQALAYQGRTQSEDGTQNRAAVSTFTTNGREINFYAHYAAPMDFSVDGDGGGADNGNGNDNGEVDTMLPAEIEYHQYPIRTMSLMNSYDDFKAGRRALRNWQDHARTESYKLKDDLQAHYRKEMHKANTRLPLSVGPSDRKRKALFSKQGTSAGLSPRHTKEKGDDSLSVPGEDGSIQDEEVYDDPATAPVEGAVVGA